MMARDFHRLFRKVRAYRKSRADPQSPNVSAYQASHVGVGLRLE